MKKCLVIGGGFAGLSASAYLSNAGYQVELIEASPKLGGRAYSFVHKPADTMIDNGQHIMMGCYKETLKFLRIINALDKIEIQEKLSVKFLYPNFELHELKASSFFYPFNLFGAILNYSAISFRERLSILRFFLKLPFFVQRDLSKISVDDLLTRENQNENIKKAFWEIICVGALNTNLKKASAKIFVDILKEIFLKGNAGSKIILPKESLSEMYCLPAKQFIEKMGGKILLSERVEAIKVEKNKAVEVRTDKRIITESDFVICAIPFYSIQKILPNLNYDDFNPQYSSILNVHVWLAETKKQNRFGKNFYALIGSKLHWVFSHDTHLTCVISDADYLMRLSDDEIMIIIYSELEKYMNITKHDIKDYFIIKEKRATFIPSNEILNNRPHSETEIKNLFLAGDWVNTGLPSTIESAVKSGRIAAEKVIAEKRVDRN
jgi:squalene-associated FAD-dependent desaturase